MSPGKHRFYSILLLMQVFFAAGLFKIFIIIGVAPIFFGFQMLVKEQLALGLSLQLVLTAALLILFYRAKSNNIHALTGILSYFFTFSTVFFSLIAHNRQPEPTSMTTLYSVPCLFAGVVSVTALYIAAHFRHIRFLHSQTF